MEQARYDRGVYLITSFRGSYKSITQTRVIDPLYIVNEHVFSPRPQLHLHFCRCLPHNAYPGFISRKRRPYPHSKSTLQNCLKIDICARQTWACEDLVSHLFLPIHLLIHPPISRPPHSYLPPLNQCHSPYQAAKNSINICSMYAGSLLFLC